MESYFHNYCRLCNSDNLKTVLTLKKSPLCDVYLKEIEEQTFYPLGLKKCNDCDFVQINFVVPAELIYTDYIYETVASPGLSKHFASYSEDVTKFLNLKSDSTIIDIGSNDGTLLKNFKDKGFNVIGIEPANEIAKIANNNNIKTYPNFFTIELANQITRENGHASVITVNNLFANVEDLNSFIESIDVLLNKNGVLIIESSYLFDMIENLVFDFIYHEHISYISVRPLNEWLKGKGFRINKIQKIATKGGSLRYYISKSGSNLAIDEEVKKYEKNEPSRQSLDQLFHRFAQKIDKQKSKLKTELQKYKGQVIAGYGASATSTTLITHFEIADDLDFLVDDNQIKIGTYSPGTHIPVLSLEKLCEKKPDLIIIIAWRFSNLIFEKIKKINCDIIVPIPEFKKLK